MQNIYAKPALLAAFICLALMVAAQLARPLFPVDETRYLTVAWEMHQSGNYVLPSLNYEAYHHKPPVLFWLINLMWAIFGVSQGAAMVVPYLGAFAFLMATARLSTRLFPDNKNAPLLATALLAGSLPFVIYANLIMFDLLLGVFAVLGLTAVWDYMTTRSKKHLLILALCIGFGVALVAGRDIGATDDDLAGAAAFQQRAILGHDGHLRASGNAHAAGLAHGWRQGVAGHLVRGLGHAVAFNQGGTKHFLHLADHLRWHGARGAANEAQRVPCDHVGAFRGARQDGLVHGGHGREPSGAGLVHPSKELQCIEAGGTKHHGTG